MKSYYILSLFIALSLGANAQTFSWATNDTIDTNLELNQTVQLKMEQEVLSDDTLTLGVEVIYNDIPSGWDGMICIEGTCLGAIMPVGFTAQMTPIHTGLNGWVRLTVNPLNGTEQAKLQIYIYDVNFPDDGDTATWLLNTTLSIDENDPLALNTSLYPNPAVDHVSISSDTQWDSFQVVAMNGQVLLEDELTANGVQEIDVTGLKSGQYFVVLRSEHGSITKKMNKL